MTHTSYLAFTSICREMYVQRYALRGGSQVAVTEALTRSCADGRISAILDVTDPEPLPPGHPLFSLPNVMITPHLAGAQGRELRRLGEFAVDEVGRFLSGAPLLGRVEPEHLAYIA
ncbi:NAD(P)-dependent oxidoreductase [Nonomuraea sp. 3N208]|uniref:NAD(P)-dependent oxidoreductase n=1 Tax=Nonomuraea sp. 3N208 TaxID=3457421 RepID=UPI003FCF35D0